MAGLFAVLIPTLSAQGWRISSNVTLNAEITFKEAFDDNIFLQNREPSALVTNAALPFQESWITTVTPRLVLDWKPLPEFRLNASYAPDVVSFHQQNSESHTVHRAGLLMDGNVGIVNWRMQNSLTCIDGSDEGLTFGILENGVPVGAPAMGGVPIRDRRAAIIYRNSFGAFHKHGSWFFRPAVSSYIHDFRTQTKDPTSFPFYQNYVDRNDFNLGVDVGYKTFADGYTFLAYRFGWQREDQLPGRDVDYSNDYQRLLLGFEGVLSDWLKLNLFAGPDWRDFNHHTPSGFEDHQMKIFLDVTATLKASKRDELILTARRFEQPGFGTPSAYEDITYEATWRHAFHSKLSGTAGFRAYGGEWEAPVRREDWIFTPSAGLAFTHDTHWSGELSYSYDWSQSEIPDTSGREYTRHLVSLALKYRF